jgi:hypothetical protein
MADMSTPKLRCSRSASSCRNGREAVGRYAAFTGALGSELASLVDLAVLGRSSTTARIQEGYMLYAHIMRELVELEVFGQDPRPHDW